MKTSASPVFTEQDIVGSVVRLLSESGYRVRTEVPNMGQSADLVATRGRWVTFIEAKKHDWRKALAQCRTHELVADYICIAVGTKSISDAFRAAASAAGYGVIHCESAASCEWVLQPQRNVSLWRPQRKRLSRVLRGISHVD